MATPGEQAETEGPQNVCQAEEEPQEHPLARPVLQRGRRANGGHDCEFVQPPPGQTECSVCLLVLRSPHLTSCCGNNFCKECIERVQKDGKACALCNTEGFTLTYNREKDVTLKQIEVYCTHRKIGCEWKGELEILDKHLNVDPELEKQLEGCAFAELQCWHVGCGQNFQRCLIAKHQFRECPRRPFSCEHCHEYESTYHDIVCNHWPVCKCYPVSCPHKCTQNAFQRQDVQKHLSKECPLQVVECEFKYAGCETKLPREDMPEHLKENVGHMSLLARQTKTLAQQNQELIARLLEKDDQIKSLMDENRREIEVKTERLANDQQEKFEQIKKLAEGMAEFKEGCATKAAVMELDDRFVELQQRSERIWEAQKAMEEQIERLTQDYGRTIGEKDEQIERLMKEIQRDVTVMEKAGAVSATSVGDGTCEKPAELCVSQLEASRALPSASHRIVFANFEQRKQHNVTWSSEAFYTHPQGYKICLRVVPNGCKGGTGTHVSCYVHLVRGEFDNRLNWPFRGCVTIKLLNQREDNGHHSKAVNFNTREPDASNSQVTHGVRAANSRGRSNFIPHFELGYTAATNCQYLMNDCLQFLVEVDLV